MCVKIVKDGVEYCETVTQNTHDNIIILLVC